MGDQMVTWPMTVTWPPKAVRSGVGYPSDSVASCSARYSFTRSCWPTSTYQRRVCLKYRKVCRVRRATHSCVVTTSARCLVTHSSSVHSLASSS